MIAHQAAVASVTTQCVRSSISDQPDIDAVVNAANAELISGGGVAGALHAAAGPELAVAAAPLAPLTPGQAVMTAAFRLPNKNVSHCLGPVYGRDEPAEALLADCYFQAIWMVEANALRSIGFPLISTGAFGYPLAEGIDVSLRAAIREAVYLKHLRLIRFITVDALVLELLCKALVRAMASAESVGLGKSHTLTH
ncbi:macro domain-containing protein [Aurantimonas sp. C2-6-R+9]|uniref:macro domain-containing protein n=1 Tax=unclassified Aurantimonas TaxID=2638230 RepID=UPI002E18BEDD|nr:MULTISPECIES: macro domain-containing protein [unclassified Aurantimonas]MEC5293315.1 macro domain-containing protein [Aurantimonas sp. C2-3-R2]MEC5383199.1 macro domain-containing protein [Aurantimonas sp. C2-6-R+9]MEC5414131.1 macro domain-containing protein [Aurantimonas sp. C2-4-R8]